MRFRSILLATLVCLSILLPQSSGPVMAQEESVSAEQQLADTYSPVAYLRYHERQCGGPPNEGEPYLPLPVDIILNNDRVLVRDSLMNNAVIATGPSAQELATLGPTTYLDFPGDPRRPGCTYETDEKSRIEELDLVPSVYARVIYDEEESKLALQYWFFWYFNHWNNTHESDWEGIQIQWDDVAGVENALATPPSRIGYSQHGNGELANWGDDKVQLEDGTHPLVYPAAGSHATFFSNDTFLAWGERNSGFGCDIAAPESVRTPLDVILLPNDVDPTGEFAWLLYWGRWGERQPGSFNGPRGPMFNNRWDEPFETFETWRPFSIVVPASDTVGPTMTEAFCGATAAGSRLLLSAIVNPLLTLPLFILAVGVILYFSRKSWPVFRQAIRVYQAHWKLFIGIGLMSIPVGIVFNALQRFFIGRQPLKFVVDWLDNTGGAELTAVLAVSGVQQLAMVLLIAPAIVYATVEVLEGQHITVQQAYRGAALHIGMIALTFLVLIAGSGVLLLTAIGFPIAIWLGVRYHFFMQAIVDEDADHPIDAFRQSARVVKGKWWQTLFATFIFDSFAIVPGILVGFGLLTIGRTAVGFANGISSLLYALLIPLSVISLTLLYRERRDGTVDDSKAVTEPDPTSKPDPILAEGTI